MGLDTYVKLENQEQEQEFIKACENYAKTHSLEPKDFDVFEYSHNHKMSWGACHSRILLHDLEKVYFGEEAHPFMHPLKKLLSGWPLSSMMHSDLTAEETQKLGDLCIQLIDGYLEALPDDHTIPNGWQFSEEGMIPGEGMNTKECLRYARKQALWFKMVGEMGYGTRASY